MNIKIILIAAGIIISLIGGGVALKYTVFKSTSETTPDFSVAIKANGAADAITVSYGSNVDLEWESEGAARCYAYGDWSGIISASGSETIKNVEGYKNYVIKCIDDENEKVLSSVSIFIDANTIPSSTTSTIDRSYFKNFSYNWKTDFCFNAKNKSDVVALQTALYLEEFFDSAAQITGEFNDETSAALKKFQEAYEIEQTGCADKETISKLNELYGTENLTYSTSSSSSDSSSKNSSTSSAQNSSSDDDSSNDSDSSQSSDSSGSDSSSSNSSSSDDNSDNDNSELSVDLKANGSDGPIDVASSSSSYATLSWTSTGATSCEAYGGWSGEKETSGEESTGDINSSYYTTYYIKCLDENNNYVKDSVKIKNSSSSSSGSSDSSDSSGSSSASSKKPQINSLNPDKWDINPLCAPAVALTVNIKGSNFDPHENELETGWSTVKDLDSEDGENIVAKIKINDDLIKKVQYEKYKIKYYTAKWKIKNSNGTSDEKDFVVFASCSLW